MLLGQTSSTPYDLRFSIFGIPVRIHPFFWVVGAIFAFPPRGLGGGQAALWMIMGVGCLFISILVHELGHALVAKLYGWPPEIVLHGLGGYALYHPSHGYTTSRAIQIALAGPGAGFVLFGFVFAFYLFCLGARVPLSYLAEAMIMYMIFINLFWGCVNLLPVYPLDGGRVAYHLLTYWYPRDGAQAALKLSFVVAVGTVFCFLMIGQPYAAILFGSMAYDNWQAMQQGGYRRGF